MGITDFSAARNNLMHAVKADWVLFLDSDEKIAAPIDPAKLDKRYNYSFKRQDWFLGRRLNFGETANVRLTRLIQPGSGKWVGMVHERFISSLPVLTLKSLILHRRKITLSQFIDRLNWYSSLRAGEINRFYLFELLVYPLVKFVKNYFWHLGFLDGLPGLAMAFMMSFHSLAVRIKQYEKMA
ncbi:MAG: Glycosyltransferase, group 2 family protein [Candidatus Beckwithbacteria bacterium GW2011_GWA2_43_10]|uniref:Glycosyltransferase, group 2 family protein n=1 Tax=Candidatus Beckwithbacteria bacterium GW2011_GWA2_43_10 TaxID=1618369 RepID=A0A0G1F001_9BACT|nr:MAG: Glycosyltransferase, group 2 family protein [Candidatus Beckwithbacteria bacterium GW2011_GWA2_43_10]